VLSIYADRLSFKVLGGFSPLLLVADARMSLLRLARRTSASGSGHTPVVQSGTQACPH